MGNTIGSVAECWQYPVKSMQGSPVDALVVDHEGAAGDRAWALLDAASGHLMSAKRYSRLLGASASPEAIDLPGGPSVRLGAPDADDVLSEWLGLPVQLRQPVTGESLGYEMTFDPPDDDAEMFQIPAPAGSFRDLAPLHLICTATLDAAAAARPELQWDVRRFRPNLVIDGGGPALGENDWIGAEFGIGPEVVIRVTQPTVRCAMPLRAQPARGDRPALDRQPELFAAMNELNHAFPNHLGAYADVVQAGRISVGDAVVARP